ncbi:MAG: STAS domain-containing protein [Oscillospiraceae bacterium]|nr:STAS domain-containing protein [Oscillospiraceae bacterium]
MVELKEEPRKLTAMLSGELDHHHAKEIREAIDFAVREQLPKTLILDFGHVTFMDSSGIGLIMGRSRLLEETGGTLEIHNPPQQIRKVLRLSGADRLAVIRDTVNGKEPEHEYAQ